MKPINPNWIMARRRAESNAKLFGHPHLEYPTYARRQASPRVQIGILRDPMAPIVIEPAIHTPRLEPRHCWQDSALAVASVVAVVASFAFVGW